MTLQPIQAPAFRTLRSQWMIGVALIGLFAQPALAAETDGGPQKGEVSQEELDNSVLLPSLSMAGASENSVVITNDTSATATITRKDIERRPSGFILNDVIKRLPGVYTGGGPGEDKDLRLRGLDKEYSRLQVDGIQLPGGGEKREFNLDILPNALIGSVTVIRNAPAEFEADGLVGRVHVETRAIPEEQQIDADIALGGTKFGSDDGWGGSFAYGNRFGEHFGFQGAVSYVDEPNIKSKDKLTAAGLLSSREVEDKPTKRFAIDLDAGYFWEGGEFHIRPKYLSSPEDKFKTAFAYKITGTTVTPNGSTTEEEDKPRRTYGLGLSFNQELGDATALEAALGYYLSTEDKVKVKRTFTAAGVETTAKREDEVENKEDGFWQGDLKLAHDWNAPWANQLKTGFTFRLRDRMREKTKRVNGVLAAAGPKDNYNLNEDYFAGFIQNEFVLAKNLTLLPGLRGEYVHLRSEDGDGDIVSSNQFDLIPSASLTWRPVTGLAFHAAASRTISRPKFDELSPFETVTATKITIGNPDLRPAKAWAFDAGVEYNSKFVTLGANLFYRDIKDVIETRLTGDFVGIVPVEQVQNVGNGWLRGLELEQRFSLAATNIPFIKGFTLTTNESILGSKLRNFSGTVGPFKEQPKFLANVILDWEDQDLGTTISAAGNYVSRIENSANGDGRSSEFFLDLKVSQRIVPGISAYFRAANLTGESREKFKTDGTFETESGSSYYYIGLTAKF